MRTCQCECGPLYAGPSCDICMCSSFINGYELDIVSYTAVFVHSEVSIPRPPRLWSEVPEGPLCCSPGGQSGLSIYVRQVRARTW